MACLLLLSCVAEAVTTQLFDGLMSLETPLLLSNLVILPLSHVSDACADRIFSRLFFGPGRAVESKGVCRLSTLFAASVGDG